MSAGTPARRRIGKGMTACAWDRPWGNDPALRFGWGEAGGAALALRWPTGAIQVVTPPASYTKTLVIPYAPAAE